MHDGWLGGPAAEDDGGCFVGFNQLDDDAVGAGYLARGQFVILDMEVSLPR